MVLVSYRSSPRGGAGGASAGYGGLQTFTDALSLWPPVTGSGTLHSSSVPLPVNTATSRHQAVQSLVNRDGGRLEVGLPRERRQPRPATGALRHGAARADRPSMLRPALQGLIQPVADGGTLLGYQLLYVQRADTRDLAALGDHHVDLNPCGAAPAKLCIHPKQVTWMHAALNSIDADLKWSQRVAEVDAGSSGAAVRPAGTMVDALVVLLAHRALARAARTRGESSCVTETTGVGAGLRRRASIPRSQGCALDGGQHRA